MRKIVIAVALILFNLTLIYSVYQKELLLKQGKVVRLALAPVDPRSLMQGDYMILRFALARDIRWQLVTPKDGKKPQKKAVISLDKNLVASLKRVYTPNEKLSKDELLLNFQTTRGRGVKISTNSYFFEEGKGKVYQKAKYGEFRVSKEGKALLVNLLDENLSRL